MKSLVILATVLTVAGANAGTILPRPAQTKMQQIVKPYSKADKCSDFSGNWVGSCKDASGTNPLEIKITQEGCEFIAFDSTAYAIGGTHQENDAIPMTGGDLFSSVTTHLNWDAKKAFLVSDSESYVSKTGAGVIYTNAYQGYVAFHEGKLVSAVQGQGVNVACTLEKR